MTKRVLRQPQIFAVDEYLSDDAGLPEKMELWDGMIGPYSDDGIQTMLANWGGRQGDPSHGP